MKTNMRQQFDEFIKRNGTKLSTAIMVMGQKMNSGEYLKVCDVPGERGSVYALDLVGESGVLGKHLPEVDGEGESQFYPLGMVALTGFNSSWLKERLARLHPEHMEYTYHPIEIVVTVKDSEGITLGSMRIPTHKGYHESRDLMNAATVETVLSV